MFKSKLSRIVAASRQENSTTIQEQTLSRLSRLSQRDPVQSAKDYQAESLKRLARFVGVRPAGTATRHPR